MLRCKWSRGLVLAASGLLMAGCASVSPAKRDAKASTKENQTSEARASAHAHYGAGVIHDMNDEADEALKEYYQAALEDPTDEGLALEVSRRFLQSKQPEKALEVLDRVAARPNASGAIYARLGFIYTQLGKNDLAIAANRTAIKKSPTALVGYQNLFLNHLQAKQPQEALKVLDEAGKQNLDAESFIALSDLYTKFGVQSPTYKTNCNTKALALLKRADKLNPGNPALRLQLAEGFNALGEYPRAAELYLDLLKKLPEMPMIKERVHARLTDIYLRSEDRKRAVEQLEAIVHDDPTNPQAYYFLGSIAYDEKKFAEAADFFSKTILLNQDFEQAYYDLAIAQMALNKSGDALATLEKAGRKFPKSFVQEFWMGMALSHQKAYKEAIRHYTQAEVIARATEPKRLTELFYFQLGAACERDGDLPQAEKNFQKCLGLAPNFAEALNYLGYMWAERGTNLDKAHEMIEKAVKLEPKNAAYLDSFAWVLYKQSNAKEALEYILKAVELNEEPDATLYDHLGDIYAALNQTAKAREAWQKSVSVEANAQVSKKLEGQASQ